MVISTFRIPALRVVLVRQVVLVLSPSPKRKLRASFVGQICLPVASWYECAWACQITDCSATLPRKAPYRFSILYTSTTFPSINSSKISNLLLDWGPLGGNNLLSRGSLVSLKRHLFFEIFRCFLYSLDRIHYHVYGSCRFTLQFNPVLRSWVADLYKFLFDFYITPFRVAPSIAENVLLSLHALFILGVWHPSLLHDLSILIEWLIRLGRFLYLRQQRCFPRRVSHLLVEPKIIYANRLVLPRRLGSPESMWSEGKRITFVLGCKLDRIVSLRESLSSSH